VPFSTPSRKSRAGFAVSLLGLFMSSSLRAFSIQNLGTRRPERWSRCCYEAGRKMASGFGGKSTDLMLLSNHDYCS
jgi:hypothetical protein